MRTGGWPVRWVEGFDAFGSDDEKLCVLEPQIVALQVSELIDDFVVGADGEEHRLDLFDQIYGLVAVVATRHVVALPLEVYLDQTTDMPLFVTDHDAMVSRHVVIVRRL